MLKALLLALPLLAASASAQETSRPLKVKMPQLQSAAPSATQPTASVRTAQVTRTIRAKQGALPRAGTPVLKTAAPIFALGVAVPAAQVNVMQPIGERALRVKITTVPAGVTPR